MNLNQVTLPATNVERSADFYRALGFTQIVTNLPSYARFECPVGTATFSLHQVARKSSDPLRAGSRRVLSEPRWRSKEGANLTKQGRLARGGATKEVYPVDSVGEQTAVPGIRRIRIDRRYVVSGRRRYDRRAMRDRE